MEEREKELRVKEEVEQRQNEAKCLAKYFNFFMRYLYYMKYLYNINFLYLF